MPKQLELYLPKDKAAPATLEDAEAARRRALADARNARRRARYAQDDEYRENARRLSRQTYEKTEGKDLDSDVEEVATNVARIKSFGAVRPIFVERAAVGDHLCLTESEMAAVIGRHHQVFQRMINDGRWPKPLYSTRNRKTKVYVFLIEEAEMLAKTYLDHIRESLHYYHSHEDTKARLYAGVDAVRKKIGGDTWQKQLTTSPR